MMTIHILSVEDTIKTLGLIKRALLAHFPEYEQDSRMRTRISVLVDDVREVHDLVFEYQGLMDNSYCRIVDLTGDRSGVAEMLGVLQYS